MAYYVPGWRAHTNSVRRQKDVLLGLILGFPIKGGASHSLRSTLGVSRGRRVWGELSPLSWGRRVWGAADPSVLGEMGVGELTPLSWGMWVWGGADPSVLGEVRQLGLPEPQAHLVH